MERSVVPWCPTIPVDSDDVLKRLGPSLRSNHLTNDGPASQQLAKQVSELLGLSDRNYVYCTSSGTAALHAVIAAFSIQAKKLLRVATQAFTFASANTGNCKNAVVLDGNPLPPLHSIDIAQDTFDLLILTLPFGFWFDVVPYAALCKRLDKFLVLDMAASPMLHVSPTDKMSMMELCDGAIVSLHETKPLGRGEGGLAFVRSAFQRELHRACNFGFDIGKPVRLLHSFASNWRMSDIAAVFISSHLAAYNFADHHKVVVYYDAALKHHGLQWAVPLNVEDPTLLSCAWIRLPEKLNAEEVVSKLQEKDIEAKHYYYPLRPLPDALALYQETICLPLHVDMTSEVVVRVVQELCIVCFGECTHRHRAI